jgi:hypothetical protein
MTGNTPGAMRESEIRTIFCKAVIVMSDTRMFYRSLKIACGNMDEKVFEKAGHGLVLLSGKQDSLSISGKVYRVSPLRKGEIVEVRRMAPEHTGTTDMLVRIGIQRRNVAVPLSQLAPIAPDASTNEAISDWHYWILQGYLL